MVEEEQAERRSKMECSLHPKDVSPSSCVGVCDATCSQDAHTVSVSIRGEWLGHVEKASYSPPTAPPRKAKPFAKALYFNGRTSAGIAWTIEIVLSVIPIRMPPPMSIGIEVAFAETTAPTNAMSGGTVAKYFRSRTSLSLPTMGERTLCIKSGPSGSILVSLQ